MGERNSKTNGSHWATKLLVCFIVLLFVINLGFAGSLSAQGSNESDNGDESNKDPYSHVQLDPRVVNMIVDEIMGLLADDYSIDPLEKELRNTIEDYIKGDYKKQLIKDILAINEAYGLPEMTVSDMNASVNSLGIDIDYINFTINQLMLGIDVDDLKELIDLFDDPEAIPGLNVRDLLDTRNLRGILDNLPGDINLDDPLRDLIEEHSNIMPSATESVREPAFIDDPRGLRFSGGNESSSSNRFLNILVSGFRAAEKGAGIIRDLSAPTAGIAALCGPKGQAFAVKAAGVGAGAYVGEKFYGFLANTLENQIGEGDNGEGDNGEGDNGEGANNEQENGQGENGQQDNGEGVSARCECEGDCTCEDIGEQEEEKPLPPDHPDAWDGRDPDEDDVDWWRTPRPDPTGPEDDSGNEDNGIIAPPPGAEPDPIGPDYDDEDHGEIEIPPGQEPDPPGPGSGDFDLPGDEDFDFEPLF